MKQNRIKIHNFQAAIQLATHCAIALILLTAKICEAQTQRNVDIAYIAVSELTPYGVNLSDAAIISDRLRAELLKTARFRVMERGQMNQILKEQAFQNSGACDNTECAIETGKLLSVNRIIAGSIGKIGDMYTMQIRLLNVQTGEILNSVSKDYTGRIEGLMTDALPELAQRLTKQGTMDSFADDKLTSTLSPMIATDSTSKRFQPLTEAVTTNSKSRYRNLLRWGAGITAGVLTGISYWEHSESIQYKKNADVSLEGYRKATNSNSYCFNQCKDSYNNNIDEANIAAKYSMYSGIGAAILAAGFTLSFVF